MAAPEVSQNAVRLYGRILEEQSGKRRSYQTEGAGFCLSLPLSELARDPQMQGVNFVRVQYVNSLERGTVFMRRVRKASREEITSAVFAAEGVELRIQMGPVDQTRILVELTGTLSSDQ